MAGWLTRVRETKERIRELYGWEARLVRLESEGVKEVSYFVRLVT